MAEQDLDSKLLKRGTYASHLNKNLFTRRIRTVRAPTRLGHSLIGSPGLWKGKVEPWRPEEPGCRGESKQSPRRGGPAPSHVLLPPRPRPLPRVAPARPRPLFYSPELGAELKLCNSSAHALAFFPARAACDGGAGGGTGWREGSGRRRTRSGGPRGVVGRRSQGAAEGQPSSKFLAWRVPCLDGPGLESEVAAVLPQLRCSRRSSWIPERRVGTAAGRR